MRLTRREGGGFLLVGAGAEPIEAVPDGNGLALRCGQRSGRARPAFGGRGAIVRWNDGDDEESGIVITWGDDATGPASVLLDDGRLLRIAAAGLAPARVEVTRWDVPGTYVEAAPDADGWRLVPTPAGKALGGLAEVALATGYEIGRRDAWF